MKVENMTSSKGNKVPNQFIIRTEEGTYFQSYNSIIAFVPYDEDKKTELGKDWNYSRTTAKYRNDFLNEGTEETRRKLEEGTYILNENL